jgi:hypothetical protein
MHSRRSRTIASAYGLRRTIAGLAAVGILLAVPAARAAFLPLPANGSQVNDDVAATIDPNLDAGVSDVVVGAVAADLEDTQRLERIFVHQETEARACRLLRQHADQDFSFVDATSFAVMRAERIRHAFAFDRHFSTAGFLRIPGDVPVEQV